MAVACEEVQKKTLLLHTEVQMRYASAKAVGGLMNGCCSDSKSRR